MVRVILLSADATRTSRLATTSWRESGRISFRACRKSIHSRSAEKNTSAGAPFSIWRASAELAANENLTGMDVSLVKASPKSCSTLVSEAAANTVMAGLSVTAAMPGPAQVSSHSPRAAQASFFMTSIMRRHGPRIIEFRERSLEILDFGHVDEGDVRIIGMMNQEVLMIILGRIKSLQRVHARDDGPRKGARSVQLADVLLRDALLALIGIEHDGAILSAHIIALPVELRGIAPPKRRFAK